MSKYLSNFFNNIIVYLDPVITNNGDIKFTGKNIINLHIVKPIERGWEVSFEDKKITVYNVLKGNIWIGKENFSYPLFIIKNDKCELLGAGPKYNVENCCTNPSKCVIRADVAKPYYSDIMSQREKLLRTLTKLPKPETQPTKPPTKPETQPTKPETKPETQPPPVQPSPTEPTSEPPEPKQPVDPSPAEKRAEKFYILLDPKKKEEGISFIDSRVITPEITGKIDNTYTLDYDGINFSYGPYKNTQAFFVNGKTFIYPGFFKGVTNDLCTLMGKPMGKCCSNDKLLADDCMLSNDDVDNYFNNLLGERKKLLNELNIPLSPNGISTLMIVGIISAIIIGILLILFVLFLFSGKKEDED